jgi:hypothetical protein
MSLSFFACSGSCAAPALFDRFVFRLIGMTWDFMGSNGKFREAVAISGAVTLRKTALCRESGRSLRSSSGMARNLTQDMDAAAQRRFSRTIPGKFIIAENLRVLAAIRLVFRRHQGAKMPPDRRISSVSHEFPKE